MTKHHVELVVDNPANANDLARALTLAGVKCEAKEYDRARYAAAEAPQAVALVEIAVPIAVACIAAIAAVVVAWIQRGKPMRIKAGELEIDVADEHQIDTAINAIRRLKAIEQETRPAAKSEPQKPRTKR